MTYIEPPLRPYGYMITFDDWNVLVNNLKDFQARLLVLEGQTQPVQQEPTNIPIGGIILWSGSIANIPQFFQLCNGTNGTPDLRNRFVPGAGDLYAPGATGGALTHTHTVGTTGSDGGHSHGVSGTTGGPSATSSRASGTVSVASASHTHDFSATSSTAGSHSHTNPSTGSASSLPPYYALAYIMRVS